MKIEIDKEKDTCPFCCNFDDLEFCPRQISGVEYGKSLCVGLGDNECPLSKENIIVSLRKPE